MKVTTVGLDLAKSVFQVHGVDEHGNTVLRKTVRRAKVHELFAQLPTCVVGMEACAGAQHWARELRKLGHDPRLMAAEFVAPYRQGGKNDANDAAAICEAVGRPKMRFVPIKSVEQQAVLAEHQWIIAQYPEQAQIDVWGADPLAVASSSLGPRRSGCRAAGASPAAIPSPATATMRNRRSSAPSSARWATRRTSPTAGAAD